MSRLKFRSYPKWAMYSDGGATGDPPSTGEGEQNSNKDANDGGQQSGNSEGNKPFAVFPDSASFMSRVKQEGRQQLKEIATELGYDSVEAMQAAAKAAKAAEEANRTELEKEKAKSAALEQNQQAVIERANTRSINSELKVFAVQAGFVDPDDAVKLVDRAGLAVDDNGEVSGAAEAIKALAEKKPHLLGKQSRTIGSSTNPGGDGADGLSEEEQGKKIAEQRHSKESKKPAGLDLWAG